MFVRCVILVFLAAGVLITTLFYYYPIDALKQFINEGSQGISQQIFEIPREVIVPLLVAEDQSFFHHTGFDWKEIRNAIFDWAYGWKELRGASTITQQLVRNFYLHRKRSFLRKIFEILWTKRAESYLSKEELLLGYLKVAQFGAGIYGLKEASRFYFALEPHDLSLSQSVFLVSLLPSPEDLASEADCQEKARRFAIRVSKISGTSLAILKSSPINEFTDSVSLIDYLKKETLADAKLKYLRQQNQRFDIILKHLRSEFGMTVKQLLQSVTPKAAQLSCSNQFRTALVENQQMLVSD